MSKCKSFASLVQTHPQKYLFVGLFSEEFSERPNDADFYNRGGTLGLVIIGHNQSIPVFQFSRRVHGDEHEQL